MSVFEAVLFAVVMTAALSLVLLGPLVSLLPNRGQRLIDGGAMAAVAWGTSVQVRELAAGRATWETYLFLGVGLLLAARVARSAVGSRRRPAATTG